MSWNRLQLHLHLLAQLSRSWLPAARRAAATRGRLDNRPRQRHPLLPPSESWFGLRPRSRRVGRSRAARCLAAPLLAADALHPQPVLDVLAHRVGKERVVLEDGVYRAVIWRQPGDVGSSSSTVPVSGSSKPAIIRRVVVFPEPEGPSRVKNSPVDLQVQRRPRPRPRSACRRLPAGSGASLLSADCFPRSGLKLGLPRSPPRMI